MGKPGETALLAAALEAGASRAAIIPQRRIVLSTEFRDICRGNGCGNYGKCWMCPPYLGEIEENIRAVRSFSHGLLYQSIGTMEDSFDIEGMTACARQHAQLSQRVGQRLAKLLPGRTLHLSCGGCQLCDTCACRMGAPCRHPRQALGSLEGYGVDVYRTVKETPLRYSHGPNTVTFFGLFLWEG